MDTALPYGLTIIGIASVCSVAICVRFVRKLVMRQISAFEFALLGFAVLQLVDVIAYQLIYFQYREFSSSIQVAALGMIALSIGALYTGYWIPLRVRSIPPQSSAAISDIERRFCLLVFPLTTIIVAGIAVWGQAIWEFYGGSLTYLPKAAIILGFWLFVATRRLRYLVAVIAIAVFALLDSSRRAFLATLFPLILIYMYSLDIKASQHVRSMAKASFVMVLLFIFLMYMRSEHDFGEGYVEGDRIANTLNYILNLRIADTFANTAFILENFPETFKYFLGETYAAILVGPIPRSIWPDKPVGLGAPLGLMVRLGERDFDYDLWMSINQFSLAPGLAGEAFANFGILGVIVVPMMIGLAAKYIDLKAGFLGSNGVTRITHRHLPYLPLLIGFCLVFRGDLYAAFIYPMFIALFLWVLIVGVRRTRLRGRAVQFTRLQGKSHERVT